MQDHAPIPKASHTGRFAQLKSSWNGQAGATSPQVVLPGDSHTQVSMTHAGDAKAPQFGYSEPHGQSSSQYQAPVPGSHTSVEVQPGTDAHSPGLPTQSHVVRPQTHVSVSSSQKSSVVHVGEGVSQMGTFVGSHVHS